VAAPGVFARVERAGVGAGGLRRPAVRPVHAAAHHERPPLARARRRRRAVHRERRSAGARVPAGNRRWPSALAGPAPAMEPALGQRPAAHAAGADGRAARPAVRRRPDLGRQHHARQGPGRPAGRRGPARRRLARQGVRARQHHAGGAALLARRRGAAPLHRVEPRDGRGASRVALPQLGRVRRADHDRICQRGLRRLWRCACR
jgi:hypothetical protein